MAMGTTGAGAVIGDGDHLVAPRRRGAVDKAYKEITRRLDLRIVLPGERLPAATQLSTEVGVSRVAILQALQILQTEGRLIVRPGRGGARVAPTAASRDLRFALQWALRTGLNDLIPFYEVILQGVGGHLARHGMNAADLAAAYALLDEVEAAQDEDERLGIENRFFNLIATATGSTMLEIMVMAARKHVSGIYDLLEVPPDRAASWLELERGLLGAIERQETGTASDVMSWLFTDWMSLARVKFELDSIAGSINNGAKDNGRKANGGETK